MKLNALGIVSVLVFFSTTSSALTLYQDPVTGQVYTKSGEGRVKMGDFVDAQTVDTKIQTRTVTKEKKSLVNSITVLNPDSPTFMLGKETRVNMKFVPQDAPDMWLKAGVRVQGTFENTDTAYNNTGITDPALMKTDSNFNDAYLRRVRFEVAAGFGEHSSFVMDIRNDRSTFGLDGDERKFNVGDAYVKIKKPFGSSLVNFKLYRAKIDVSRTETVKSAWVTAYDRPFVADAAAQYISLNRRAANIQMYGDWKKKIHYQIAAGDASNPSKTLDAADIKGTDSSADIDISDQSFFYGGKVRVSPFDGWEETKRTETYFGEGKHFSVGVGYWAIPTMKGENKNGATFDLDRKLLNIEASAHYKGLFVQAEWFQFKDTVESWGASSINTGDSTGWYGTVEYVFKDLNYLAPFARYESWDRFDDKNGFDIKSTLVGVNWYLRGNTTKVGLVYQKDELGVNTGDADIRKLRLTSQWFF